MFSFPTIDPTEWRMSELEVSELVTPFRRAKCDLELMVAETRAGLSVNWTYATSLFRKETIVHVANYFFEILECMASDPQHCLRQLPDISREPAAVCSGRNASAGLPVRRGDPGTETTGQQTFIAGQDGVVAQFDAFPASHTLSILTDIWAAILQRPAASIGHHTNFFDAGGNSLSIIAVRAAIKSELAITVSVADLFEHSTLFRLHRFINGRNDGDASHQPELRGAKARVLRARSIKLSS